MRATECNHASLDSLNGYSPAHLRIGAQPDRRSARFSFFAHPSHHSSLKTRQHFLYLQNQKITERMLYANTNWILLLFFAVVARGAEVVVATRGEGECSANDESCVADDGVEPAEVVLTECQDTEKDCKYWASLGEVSLHELKNEHYTSAISLLTLLCGPFSAMLIQIT
jgi:hypothetical protein